MKVFFMLAVLFLAADSPVSSDKIKQDLVGKTMSLEVTKGQRNWKFDESKEHAFDLEIQKSEVQKDKLIVTVSLKNFGGC